MTELDQFLEADSMHTGRLLKTIATTVGLKPVLYADGSALTPGVHPILESLTPQNFSVLGSTSVSSTIPLRVDVSTDGTLGIQAGYITDTGTTVYLTLNEGIVATYGNGTYFNKAKPAISGDGARAIYSFRDSTGGTNLVYKSAPTTLTARALNGTNTGVNKITAPVVSKDGTKMYVFTNQTTNATANTSMGVFDLSGSNGATTATTFNVAGFPATVTDVYAAACSSNGAYVYVVPSGTISALYVSKSTNNCVNFTHTSIAADGVGSNITLQCSDDGSKVLVCSDANQNFLSTDFGVTFTPLTNFSSQGDTLEGITVGKVTMRESDGRLYAVALGNEYGDTSGVKSSCIKYSDDNGVTWKNGIHSKIFPSTVSDLTSFVEINPTETKAYLTNSSDNTASRYEILYGKFLPKVNDYKIIGG